MSSQVTSWGPTIDDQGEQLVRRGRRDKKQGSLVLDQRTGQLRPPATIFEPRAKDEYLSVNLGSSLQASGLSLDWGCDRANFFIALLEVQACQQLGLPVTHEPIVNVPGQADNPHHAGIRGLKELEESGADEAYEAALNALAAACSVPADHAAGLRVVQ